MSARTCAGDFTIHRRRMTPLMGWSGRRHQFVGASPKNPCRCIWTFSLAQSWRARTVVGGGSRRGADAVAQPGDADHLGAMLAAEEGALLLEPVADDAVPQFSHFGASA